MQAIAIQLSLRLWSEHMRHSYHQIHHSKRRHRHIAISKGPEKQKRAYRSATSIVPIHVQALRATVTEMPAYLLVANNFGFSAKIKSQNMKTEQLATNGSAYPLH